jgi:hypothetical protein
MPDNSGSTPHSQGFDLRLWVPAEGGRLRGIASEIATKVAEYLGSAAPDAASIGTTVERLASTLGNGGGHTGQDIHFSFRRVDGELVIEARRDGEASEVRHRLPA